MKANEEFILDTLSKSEELYLKSESSSASVATMFNGLDKKDFAICRIDEITFEEKSPRKEALENVISSMNIAGVNFIYLIVGNENRVSFYYGVAKNITEKKDTPLEINDIGEQILQPSLQGNFRGSKITELSPKEREELLKTVAAMKYTSVLEGVPGINKDDEDFQSVDRIVDVMLGKPFAIMLIAKPMTSGEISAIRERTFKMYDIINPIAKTSVQQSTGKSEGSSSSVSTNESRSSGTSTQTSEQKGSSTQKGESSGTSHSTGSGTSHTSGSENNQSTTTGTNSSSSNKSKSGTEGSSKSRSDGTSTNISDGTTSSTSSSTSTSTSTSSSSGESKQTSEGTSKSDSTQTGSNTSSATTLEIVNKKVQEWVKYIDEVIIPRIDYGAGKGLFVTEAILLGETQSSLIKLENTIRSIYGGESGNKMSLRAFPLSQTEASYAKNFQIPNMVFKSGVSENELFIRNVCSQYLPSESNVYLGSWMSSKELSLFAGLPQKEVIGLALREEVEFGLNTEGTGKKSSSENKIKLGHLVQSGVVLNGENSLPNIEVEFDRGNFDKHIFVTGVTGSGKTTTCQRLLIENGGNFLVIEPAKTEYRILAETKFPDMLVFTLGKENAAPFRLNPFEFFKGENITSRVDMIKASMEAAFDMEAAIPQLLEASIYKCYENKGWDISTNKNKYFSDPFAQGVKSFPTLSELMDIVPKVVKEQGFDERLHDEYVGSIKARLQGLTVGAKGLMLDTPRSINFEELLERKVVIELEDIKSASEKSLVMGFILANLSEAIKRKYITVGKDFKHITLVEEAHRLLSKYMPGDSGNKKQGVEMFADMLAEVRKYGESLIIADQIPNKLTPEVLKNTNTKIVHKIFAQDDKEAIGNTMALEDEQKKHLSYLEAGRCIMASPDLSKAIQIQILQDTHNDTGREPPEDKELRKRILEYYRKNYKSGVLPGLEHLENEPSVEDMEMYFEYFQPKSEFVQEYKKCLNNERFHKNGREIFFAQELSKVIERYGMEKCVLYIRNAAYGKDKIENRPKLLQLITSLLTAVKDSNGDFSLIGFEGRNKIREF